MTTSLSRTAGRRTAGLRIAGLLVATAAAVTVTACTAASEPPVVVTSTVVQTSTAPATTIPPKSEAPIAQTVTEVEAPDNTCPYISNDAARAAEGDRVGRVTLTTSTPPGCNFYWPYDDQPMVLSISVTNYPSQLGAYNAMIRDTKAAPEVIGVPALVPRDGCTTTTPQGDRPTTCVDAVLYRTTFFPPDGNTDWAAKFAVDSRVITVNTRQNDTSFNARNVAAQIAARF